MNKLKTLLCALGLGFVLATSVQAATDVEAIAERIKPTGSVCLEGDDSCGGAAAAPVASGPRTGKEVYEGKCAACHSIGVAGAPKFGTSDWTERAEKGMATLVKHAINGINAMPARGTCADCSDEEIENAVAYMVDSAK